MEKQVFYNLGVDYKNKIKNDASLWKASRIMAKYEIKKQDWHVGEKIRELRVAQEMSQKDLGDVLGIDKSEVSRIEGGYRSISIDFLVALADLFKVSTDYILARDLSVNEMSNAWHVVKEMVEDYMAQQLR